MRCTKTTGLVCDGFEKLNMIGGEPTTRRRKSGRVVHCRSWLSIWMVLVAGTFLFGKCDLEDPDSIGADDPRFQEVVQAVEEELSASNASGAAVAIIEKGEVTFARGFGTKHPNRNRLVQAGTLFRMASVNKMMTAVGLLQQVEAGAADLDDPITDHLPTLSFELDETWAPSITLRHLLTHTSGLLADAEGNTAPEYQTETGLSDFLLGEFTEFAYLLVPAGTMYNYSNTGYEYAGLVTETLSTTPYPTYMEHPDELKHSVAYHPGSYQEAPLPDQRLWSPRKFRTVVHNPVMHRDGIQDRLPTAGVLRQGLLSSCRPQPVREGYRYYCRDFPPWHVTETPAPAQILPDSGPYSRL